MDQYPSAGKTRGLQQRERQSVLPSLPPGDLPCFTCEGDVESFIGHGEIRDEADLGSEVAIESSADGGWQP